MPIYTYDCPEDGTTDVFFRAVGPPFEMDCPECKGQMQNCVTAPAQVNIDRDWNEKANDYRRDPYTQAKAQLTNINRRAAEGGESQTPITEEAIQVGAKAIHEHETAPPGPSIEEKHIRKIRGKK